MSSWISYDDFVDLVRNYHHDGFSGLITGVSDEQHAFKIGFHQGEIELVTYRVKKGMPALDLLARMSQAKITVYATTAGKYQGEGMPDTATILSQLTANTLDDTNITEISEVPEIRQPQNSVGNPIDARTRERIEAAAIHYFGPIGAMICDELLEDYRGDIRTAVFAIAQEVGASEEDTRAFFNTVAANRGGDAG